MSGFTRDTKHYGDRLVYEALDSKWSRHHARCGCGQDWVAAHAEPAGFTVVREGSGFVALTGPGLTEGVDESALTTDALWEAVTGEPGSRGRVEAVRVIDRSDAAEAERKAANERYRNTRPRRATARETTTKEPPPATDRQVSYIADLAAKVGRERFAAAFAAAVEGTSTTSLGADEKARDAAQRITKEIAKSLISTLVDP